MLNNNDYLKRNNLRVVPLFLFPHFCYNLYVMRRRKGLDFNHKRRNKISTVVLKEIFSWLFWIGISAVTAVVLVYVFGLRTNVVGNSMEPHLYAGQKILINRLVYQISEPKFGDVIAFQPNGNENSHYYVKRVIGVPGDTLVIKNGRIFINDEELKEDESYDKIAEPGIAESELHLAEGEYFVLGDNRNFSEDSRSGNIGIVKDSYIIGKVWFKLSDKLEYMGIVK